MSSFRPGKAGAGAINPFVTGTRIDDERRFYGRDSLVEELLLSRHVLLYGQSRTGKSSVLHRVAHRSRDGGGLPFEISFEALATHRQLVDQLGNDLDILAETIKESGTATRALPSMDDINRATGLPELRDILERLASTFRGGLLVLADEVKGLKRIAGTDPAVIAELSQFFAPTKRIRFIAAGTWDCLPLCLANASGDAVLPGFNPVPLPVGIDPEPAARLVRQEQDGGPAGMAGLDLPQKDLDRLLERTGCAPFVLQSVCAVLWGQIHAGSPPDVEAALKEFLHRPEAHLIFKENDDRLHAENPAAAAVLEKLAFGRATSATDDAAKSHLRSLGFIDHNERFSIPLLRSYLVARAPVGLQPRATSGTPATSDVRPQESTKTAPPRRTDRYWLDHCIGRGEFGEVYRGEKRGDDGFRTSVAIKIMHAHHAQSEDLRTRMAEEARVLGRLRHPNIVGVTNWTQIETLPAIVMEYLDGFDLGYAVDERCRSELHAHPWTEGMLAELLADVADALHWAFAEAPEPGMAPLGVTHRDIKPSNLCLTPHGTVRLLDFGLAAWNQPDRATRSGSSAVGTPRYMAPERLADPAGSRHDPQSDVFSLGVVCAQLLTGAVHRQPTDLAPGGVSPLLALLRRMLQPHPSMRPTPAEVRDVADSIDRASPRGKGLREWFGIARPVVDRWRRGDLSGYRSRLDRGQLRPEGDLASLVHGTTERRTDLLVVRQTDAGSGWTWEAFSNGRCEAISGSRLWAEDAFGEVVRRVGTSVVRGERTSPAPLVEWTAKLWAEVPHDIQPWLAARSAPGELRVVSDLNAAPWELLGFGQAGGPLGSRCAVGRQLLRDGIPIRTRPATRSLSHALLVFDRETPGAEAEAGALEQLLRSRGVQCVVVDMRSRARPPTGKPFDLIHVALHDLDPSRTNRPAALADSSLLGRGVLAQQIDEGVPPVMCFLNACSSVVGIRGSRDERVVPGASNNPFAEWALERCALVIGTLFPVNGREAAGIAEGFYRQALDGAPVGEALRGCRERAAEVPTSNPWPAWAAYVLYGDPASRLDVPGAAPEES